jgi:hypothetical protein
MKPIIFTSHAALAADALVTGHFTPAADTYLLQARLRLSAPTNVKAVIALEINGVEQPERFIAPPGVSVIDLVLNVEVAAGALVQWRTVSADDGTFATIVMDVAAISEVPPLPLEVWWRSGSAQLKVYDYDADTHAFTATALAAGRCSRTGTDWALTSATLMRFAAAGAVAVGWSEFLASGTGARLEFRHGDRSLLVLDSGGVHVETLIEATPVDVAETGFEFYDGVTRAASVNRLGFRALTVTHDPVI